MSRKTLIVDKTLAAISQLESALWLWFTKDDPISTHVLTMAALDCYSAVGAHRKKPSFTSTFLKTKSGAFQKRFRRARNFFEHGLKDLTGSVTLDTLATDSMLIDCALCHKELQLKITPLIQLFWFRIMVEQPDLRSLIGEPDFSDEIRRHGLDRMSRQEFLDEVLPHVEGYLTKKSG